MSGKFDFSVESFEGIDFQEEKYFGGHGGNLTSCGDSADDFSNELAPSSSRIVRKNSRVNTST
eukprot:CAMPEP_0182449952 /NCGR_PEP_ID=MMETSP1172-20130603/37829_1 /TAXON_ID=708627 /ORGANISM="Timspurckia oligopyrenoides, Strain CCMP3278" /LENGTH=62 /DNA_ID=CAMNT_0024647387 /DNA_START=49 /DNA_END=233 /DNA_ORIENTATION=+